MSRAATADLRPDWPTCRSKPDCIGVQVAPFDSCLAHLTRDKFGLFLRRLNPGSEIDGRGTCFTGQLLAELLDAVTDPDTETVRIGCANFTRAEFDEAHFTGVEFCGDAVFDGARFHRAAQFAGATFGGGARFRDTRFHREADFTGAVFVGNAVFSGAAFHGGASFHCQFDKTVWFGPDRESSAAASFRQEARFDGARFGGDARFEGLEVRGAKAKSLRELASERAGILHRIGKGTEFAGAASFDGAVFVGVAAFRGVTFAGHAGFGGAVFEKSAQFGAATFAADAGFACARFQQDAIFAGGEFRGEPGFAATEVFRRADFRGALLPSGGVLDLASATDLDISGLQAGERLVIRCTVSRHVEASGIRCPQGMTLQLQGSIEVNASEIRSPGSLTFTYQDGLLTLADAIFVTPATISHGNLCEPAPRLLSLDRVDATNLTLVGLDLTVCEFLGCCNLDKLRIEGDLASRFAGQPASRRWAGRLVLADELTWKSTGKARGEAARVAAIYRALRKGREDAKDMPGAADFYYGEMEMRRFATSFLSRERALLTAYWTISGYGSRVSQPLAVLLVVILLDTAGFAMAGSLPWGNAFVESLASVSWPLRAISPVSHTSIGSLMVDISLRILGPLLAGQVFIAVHRRLKR